MEGSEKLYDYSLNLEDEDEKTSTHSLLGIESGHTFCERCVQRQKSSPSTRLAVLGAYIAVTIVNIIFFMKYATSSCGLSTLSVSNQQEMSMPSPILKDIDLSPHRTTINGYLFNTSNPSIFRQHPSPAVDEAWSNISETINFLVSAEDLQPINKDPRTAVRVPDSWAPKSDPANIFVASLDGPHQLHCLNEIRKQVYAYHYFPKGPSHPLHWEHVGHCLDIVRQALMCTASTEVLTNTWVETQTYPYPDFKVEKKCRDYNAILQWARERRDEVDSNPEIKWLEWTKDRARQELPGGIEELEMERGYYDYADKLEEYFTEGNAELMRTGDDHEHEHQR